MTVLSPNLSCHHHSINNFCNSIYSTLYSMISIMGFVGDGMVLYVLIRTYRQKTAFQVYMLNLALSNFLCVLILPLHVIYYVHKGHWFFSDLLCHLSSYVLYVNLYCIIFFMMAMSFFRCIAIIFPVRNISLVLEKKAKFVCFGIQVFITLTSAPFLWNRMYLHGNKTKCFKPPENAQKTNLVVILDFITLFVGFIFPFIVITICYAMIIVTLPLAAANCCFDPLLYFFSGGNFQQRLTTLRKASSSSLSQAFRQKISMKDKEEEPFRESQRANGRAAVAPL